jgi:hypothetical protein
MFGELVAGVCLTRAVWRTVRLMQLNIKISGASWPIVTSSADTLPKTPGSIALSQLHPNCKAIVLCGPDKQKVVQPAMVMVGHMVVPIGGGEIEISEGYPEFTCVHFNTPHNLQKLHSFDLPDLTQPRLRYIHSEENLFLTLDEWNIPRDELTNRFPRLVKVKVFDSSTPVFCISGPNYSGISVNQHTLISRMLLNNRGTLYFTSWIVGLCGVLFLTCFN